MTVRTLCALLLIAVSGLLFVNGFAAAFLGAAALLYPTIDANGRLSLSSGLTGYAIYAALSAGGFVLAYVLYRIARRLSVPVFASLADVQAAARRRRQGIIVFLREFTSDTARRERDVHGLRDYFITQEELIARAASAFGLVVAIGRPGEKLPPGGAARLYVSEDEWQGAVDQLIELAEIVVIRIGATPGISWEIERLVSRGKIERTIFVPWSRDDAHGAAALERLETLLGDIAPREELVPAELRPMMTGMSDLQRDIVEAGERMLKGASQVFSDVPEMRDAIARFKATHEASKASQRNFELGYYSVPTLMVRHGTRLVPFFEKTGDAVRHAAKLLGLTPRPNRLLIASLVVSGLVTALLLVSTFVNLGCGFGGLDQCAAYALDAWVVLFIATLAVMATAFVLWHFSFV